MKLSDININDLSPMMQQYAEIKNKYKDELLFFRLGDFYELFFEDADIASRELELTLTGKNAGLKERVPMCGVPHHSAKSYIEKLVNKGFHVAICEQLEDPKTTKNMVKRDVIEVLTKGTLVDLEFLNASDTNYIGSIIDFNYIYLITYTDISTGEINSVFVNHNNDSIINEVLNLNLKEMIIKEDFSLELINIFKNNYGININISNEELNDKFTSIYEDIDDERIIVGVKHVLYYLHIKQLKDLSHLSKLQIIKKDDYLRMDVHTIRNLELIETIRLKERKYSLIWLLDKTKTAPGARCLKNWLMNPLKDKNEIEKRYDYVDLLNNNFLEREQLRECLYEIYDLERLCGKVICGSLNARDLLQIKNSIKVIPIINEILKNIKYGVTVIEHKELYELLESAINEDAPISIKEGNLIKKGYSEELDELRSIRSGGKEFISNIEAQEKARTGIQNLKVGFNKVFGYYIEVTKGQIDKIDPSLGWERRQTLTGAERFITPELKEKEELILNAEEKINTLEYELFTEIRNIIKENIFKLKQTAQTIAEIDSLASLSVVSEEQHFIRPKLNNDNNINIIDGFHPVVKVVSNQEYINNDIIMDKNKTTLLITGPNMSGKSTYMRQLAITAILAQTGSFVPASHAELPIFDSIFTRIGASDDLVSGESTFMVEMLEAKNAICNATKNSLILFDELGRGTSTFDGMSLARAILEYVNTSIGCKTLFSTHYHELTDLENKYQSIKNVHVDAIEENGNITFLHKVLPGSVSKSYGIHVAKLAGMPEELLKRADEFLSYYENESKNKNESVMSEQIAFNLDEKQDNELEDFVKSIDPLSISPLEAINILFKIKEISNKK
ncbi:MAG: DNA mismatch repair protein MutS [Erysipelotrichales bacterium]|nr:DNA mismatch repair protein MutS [Erysipelotrichales bacterium]